MITGLTVGGLIYHIVSVEPAIPDTMAAPSAIIRIDNHNLLLGENSVREPIIGYGYDFNLVSHDTGSINFKLGGYFQEQKPFIEKGIQLPFHSFMPIMGFEFNMPLSKKLDVTTVITPLMTYTGLTFRF